MADTSRDVELRLRASNLTTAGLKEAITNLNALNSSLESQAKTARDALAAHQAAMAAGTASGKAAETAMRGYERALSAVEKQLQTNRASVARFTAELQKQNEEARRAEVSGYLTAFNARIEANKRQVKALQDFNAETKRLTAQRHSDETTAARKAVDDIRKIQQEGQRVQLQPLPTGTGPRTDALGRPGRGASAQVGFLGLRPYELTNLGYQVNDVVSGLVSGQNAMQVLAQQGGQFIQIFGTQVLRYFPLVAAAAAGVAVAIGAITAAVRDLNAARELNLVLSLNANGAHYTTEALLGLRKEIRQLGIEYKDADVIIRQSIATGLNQDRIREFAEAARVLADTFGKSVPDAFKELTEAASGGIEGIRKFNLQYNILTDDELKSLRTYKDVDTALRAIITRLIENKDKSVSPLTQSVRQLSIAWDDFITSLSESKVFTDLIDYTTTLVNKLTDMIGVIDRLAAKVDDPKFQLLLKALKVVINPVGAASDLVGAGVTAIGNPTLTKAAQDMGILPPPSGPGRFETGSMKIDTESLVQLARILNRASYDLPAGYKVRTISTERPGATVKDTGGPSEHGAGRAIDIEIVDPEGRVVPGAMGSGGPLYDALDKAVEQAAAAMLPGVAIAIGSRFKRRKDAGHYSMGGEEAARQGAPGATGDAGTAPATREPTAAESDTSRRLVESAERQLQIQFNINQAKARTAAEAEARLKVEKETQVVADQDRLVAIEMAKFDQQQSERKIEFERQLATLRESDGRNAAAIAAAGERAREKARADAAVDEKTGTKLITIEQLRRAEIQGQQEERARITKQEQADEAVRQVTNQVRQSRRENDLKNASELAKAEEAVNEKYDTRLSLIEREIKLFPQKQADLELAKQRLEVERQRALALARVDQATAAGKEALQTRNTLVQTYTELEAKGEISITEKEARIKAAYDLTRSSILGAADALQKIIDTDKSLTPEKIALYTAEVAKLRAEAKYVDPFFKGLKDAFSESFTSGITTAFETISEAIGGAIAKTKEWKDVFVSVRQAGIQLFAQLLKDIATYILKAQAAKIASSLFSGGGGDGIGGFFGKLLGFGSQTGTEAATATAGAASSSASTGLFGLGFLGLHGGGVAGRGTYAGSAPASWWQNAPRYHSGRMVGLGPDEEAAILKRGEEVISADNPRNIMNGGGGRAGEINIRNVLVDDRSRIPEAMTGAHGERVIMQHIVNNAATIREAVKDS